MSDMILNRFPFSEEPPEEGEGFSKIADDFQSLILPGRSLSEIGGDSDV